MSWGGTESWYVTYYNCTESLFRTLTLKGITLINSSGDKGYKSRGTCASPAAQYPATSAYVTTVGATMLSTLAAEVCMNQYGPTSCSTQAAAEIVCSLCSGSSITSGGGFSVSIMAPAYMTAVQAAYLNNSTAAMTAFQNAQNTTAGYTGQRGYPDIALLGNLYPVYADGVQHVQDGTSASAPLFAAMVTLLNQARQQAGMGPMGYITPFLYNMGVKFPQLFNDVVVGDNSCGENGDAVGQCGPDQFYPAALGWDATTGLGSPRFHVLLSLALDPTGMSLMNVQRQGPTGPTGQTGPMGEIFLKFSLDGVVLCVV